ncbi:MAG: type II toxin-antitoxin system VapC family toxin [Candidatus Nitrosotenuis sp.]
MVCLDTDFLIELARKNPTVQDKLVEFAKKGEVIYTTTISIAEFYAGIYSSRKGWSEERAKRFFDSFATITLDNESARMCGKLMAIMKSNTIGDSDLIIASIVVSNNQTLITKNKKHFERVPGLRIEDW